MDSLGGQIGTILSHNVFAYCMNNPINLQDPSGKVPVLTIIMVSGFIAWGAGTLYSVHKQKKSNGKVDYMHAISYGASWGYTVMIFGMAAYSVVSMFSSVPSNTYRYSPNRISNGGGRTVKGEGNAIKGSNPIGKDIIRGLKNAKVQYKTNPITKNMEPYIKQYKIDNTYKAVLRRDIGGFSHGQLDHWNLEIQTLRGNMKYDLHIYVDEFGEVVNTAEYIPKK